MEGLDDNGIIETLHEAVVNSRALTGDEVDSVVADVITCHDLDVPDNHVVTRNVIRCPKKRRLVDDGDPFNEVLITSLEPDHAGLIPVRIHDSASAYGNI